MYRMNLKPVKVEMKQVFFFFLLTFEKKKKTHRKFQETDGTPPNDLNTLTNNQQDSNRRP